MDVERVQQRDNEIKKHLKDGLISAKPSSGEVFNADGKRFNGRTNGYVNVSVRGSGYLAHRVVWVAEHGDIDSSLVINHVNSKRDDNRIVNLEQVTNRQNLAHHYGTHQYEGVRHEDIRHVAEVNPEWFAKVRALAESGEATAEDIEALRAEVQFERESWQRSDRQMRRGVGAIPDRKRSIGRK